MKKLNFLLIFFLFSFTNSEAQTDKAVYIQIGGPGIASANFDTRFGHTEDGLGGRVGVGAFYVHESNSGNIPLLTVPIGLNYLIGKDGKNYFEVGAGFTYMEGVKEDKDSNLFNGSFGNLTIGYRFAPAKGGFMFKAEITPVFAKEIFVPYFGGLGFGYKF